MKRFYKDSKRLLLVLLLSTSPLAAATPAAAVPTTAAPAVAPPAGATPAAVSAAGSLSTAAPELPKASSVDALSDALSAASGAGSKEAKEKIPLKNADGSFYVPDPTINPKDPFAITRQLAHTYTVDNPGMGPDGTPFSLAEAICFTIENQIAIGLAQLAIEVQRGSLRAAAGPFDYNITAGARYTDEHNLLQYPRKTKLHGNNTTANASIVKLTRPGTQFTARANVNKVNSPSSKPVTKNNANLTLIVQQPLLRGFLNGKPWMAEQAAEFKLYAAYYDDFQAIAQNIYNTTAAYWDAVAAQNALEVQMVGTRRIVEVAAKVNELIKNGQLARTSYNQTAQQQMSQTSALLGAEKRLYGAVQNLRKAMGDVSITDMRDLKLNLTDDVKITPLNIPEFEAQFEQYLDYAMAHSYDIQASTLRQSASALMLKGADNNCLPQLNLVGELTELDFTNAREGKELFSPLHFEKPQTNWIIGVNLSMALYNDGAEGAYESQRATFAQDMLKTQQITQKKVEDLRGALSEQINLWLRLQEAEKSIAMSQQVYNDSFQKFEAGLGTLFDLLSYSNALTRALIERKNLTATYMKNIAMIRLLTASTFLQGEDNSCIEVLDITTLPEFNMFESDLPKVMCTGTRQTFQQTREKVWKER